MSKIWRVEEEQIMKAGKITGTNYTVWYKDENGARTARRDYREGQYKVIPMTVLNFILDESNEANTKYQEFDGCIYKRTMYQEEKKMENINMTTAQEDIEDAIKFGWIEAQEATNDTNTSKEMKTMKQFKIVDCVSNHDTIVITSNNGKNALKQFLRNYCMSTGFYEIHKRCNRWIMTSSFGSYFVAMPIK